MNPNFVSDIITIRNPVGMMNNAGVKLLTLKATVKGLGHVWYDPTQVDNIFCFSLLK